ncbi:MAG: substrate-binding periplasmic protein [Fibrobacterota bacterium]
MSTVHLFFLCSFVLAVMPVPAVGDTLSVGFAEWKPFRYVDTSGSYTGYDYELLCRVLDSLGIVPRFYTAAWRSQLVMLREGRVDILMSAARTAQRDSFALFSKPYRRESYSLFYNREISPDSVQLRKIFRRGNLTVAVQRGYTYGKTVDSILEQTNPDRIVQADTEKQLLQMVSARRAPAAILESAVGSTMVADGSYPALRTCFIADAGRVFFMFSRKTVRPDFVAAFNRSLDMVVTDTAGNMPEAKR